MDYPQTVTRGERYPENGWDLFMCLLFTLEDLGIEDRRRQIIGNEIKTWEEAFLRQVE